MKVNVQPGPAVESLPMSKGHLRTWGWQKWIHLCWQSVNHSDKGKRYLQQFWQWVKDISDNNPYKEWAAHLSNVKVSSCPLWLRVPAKEANSGLRWSLNWWSVWFWLRLVMIEVEWVGVNYGYWINDPHLGTFLWPPTINLRTWLHIRRGYSRENNPSTEEGGGDDLLKKKNFSATKTKHWEVPPCLPNQYPASVELWQCQMRSCAWSGMIFRTLCARLLENSDTTPTSLMSPWPVKTRP